MLDANALSQLSQLKHTIRADKNLTAGTVRGSQGRFGFVNLDDGREIFLAPDDMARVLPGDRVEVSLVENSEGEEGKKLQGELDKLLSSTQKTLVGQYIVRGKAHFVSVDMPQLSRWVFLPPKERGKAKEGDYVICRLTRHPFQDGKAQAKVTDIIGKADEPGIEHKVTCARFGLRAQWTDKQLQEATALKQVSLQQLPDFEQRSQLQQIPFITIDSATTQDMDDALYAEADGSGWQLWVAIADPSATLTPGSALDRAAQQRANTAYLPGNALTMLPQELSHDVYSLVPGEDRPALLCRMRVAEDGTITEVAFELAIIRSHHKLTYRGVADFLANGNREAVPADVHDMLQQLAHCSTALNGYRARNLLLMEDRDDYSLVLNERGHISTIERETRNIAQQIVEESMLATNRSAGDFFAQHANSGIYSSHAGFRPERMESIRFVIDNDAAELAELDVTTLEGYRQLIRKLQNSEQGQAALASLKLMLQAGVLTTEPLPHMGLGMAHYATITSPIRRYHDLHNHRVLKAILRGETVPCAESSTLETLQQALSQTRQASRDLEQWLQCLFLQQHSGETLQGRVSRVTSQGVSVQLIDWGIVGFVKLNPKQFTFDQHRMVLTGESQNFCLNQPIEVTVEKVDLDKKRVNFRQVIVDAVPEGETPVNV